MSAIRDFFEDYSDELLLFALAALGLFVFWKMHGNSQGDSVTTDQTVGTVNATSPAAPNTASLFNFAMLASLFGKPAAPADNTPQAETPGVPTYTTAPANLSTSAFGQTTPGSV